MFLLTRPPPFALRLPSHDLLAIAFAALMSVASRGSRAATIVWGDSDNAFSPGASWVGGVAPANNTTSDIASFGSAGSAPPVLDAARSVAGLAFTATSAVTLSGAFTLTLGASGISNTSASGTKTVSSNLSLAFAQSFTNSGVLTLSGAIANGGNLLTLAGTGTGGALSGLLSGTGGLTKSGSGTWALSGLNTQTGTTTVSAGVLTVNSGARLSSNTTAAPLIVNGGTLNLNNAAQTVSSLSGTGGTINFGTGHVLTLAQIGATSYTGALGGAGSLTFGGGGTATFSGGGTLTGTLTATAGSTYKLGANDGLATTAKLNLTAANLALNNFTQSALGTLSLGSGASTIDFGSAASSISFADSHAATWSGTLTITSYTYGSDTFKVGGSSSSLTSAQLASITFSGYALGGAASITSAGVVFPSAALPEPAICAALAGSAALLFAVRRRRTARQ